MELDRAGGLRIVDGSAADVVAGTTRVAGITALSNPTRRSSRSTSMMG
jgi:hypothetical protein